MTRSGRMARARLGDAAGTRALVEVLLLHRRLPAADVHGRDDRRVAAGQPVRRTWSRSRPATPAAGPTPDRSRSPLVLQRRATSRDGEDLQQVTVLPTDPRPLPTVAPIRPAAHPRRDRAELTGSMIG